MLSSETIQEIKSLLKVKRNNTITDSEDSRLRDLTTNLDKPDFYYVMGLVFGGEKE